MGLQISVAEFLKNLKVRTSDQVPEGEVWAVLPRRKYTVKVNEEESDEAQGIMVCDVSLEVVGKIKR